jgi:mannobiose 2-epimerase
MPAMPASDLEDYSRKAGAQLYGHILPFWCGPALDREQGGWMAWLSNDLKPDRSQPKGLILNSRILWTFSAVHRAGPQPLFRQLADRALDTLLQRFWDKEHGGAFWRLDGGGRALDDSKKIYGQAFCIYALAEHFRAFGAAESLQRAKELFELLERHARDPRGGGYWEVRRRDWSEAGPDARLSDKDMNEKKSMNNHLHLLEAFANLSRVWDDPRIPQRLRELISLFEERIFDSRTGHFQHFFDEQWNVRSDTCTYGHDIEGNWLLCEAAEALADPPLLRRVESLAMRLAETVLREGVAGDGGLCYEGKSGRVIDTGRECWPQAEAAVGFLNAWQISGEDRYYTASRRAWDYIEEHLVDRVHGEWFWRIAPDGRLDPTLPKVSEWKGPYHGSRACLEIMRRLG